jgi:hypothetical protein
MCAAAISFYKILMEKEADEKPQNAARLCCLLYTWLSKVWKHVVMDLATATLFCLFRACACILCGCLDGLVDM